MPTSAQPTASRAPCSHAYGDAAAAALVARSARAPLRAKMRSATSGGVVREQAAGRSEVPLRMHDPLHAHIAEPVHLQLASSDGASTHAIARPSEGCSSTQPNSARSHSRAPLSTAMSVCT